MMCRGSYYISQRDCGDSYDNNEDFGYFEELQKIGDMQGMQEERYNH